MLWNEYVYPGALRATATLPYTLDEIKLKSCGQLFVNVFKRTSELLFETEGALKYTIEPVATLLSKSFCCNKMYVFPALF